VSKPTLSKPPLSKPTLSKPTLSKPTLSKPTVSKPTVAQPAVPTPAVPTPAVPTPGLYQPGVCNIGAAEIRIRRLVGFVGLGISVILIAIFVAFSVPAPWRAFVLLPAGLGAAGFLQAALHFCARFAMAGLFNFGANGDSQEAVYEAEFRRKDQRKAYTIIGLSALISFAVLAVALMLP
jgi:hypothetical protein